MRGVDLRGARYGGDLGTSFRNVDLTGADLRTGIGLDLIVWENTICPDGTNSDDDDGDGATCLSNLNP